VTPRAARRVPLLCGWLALTVTVPARHAAAATAYVSDELVLGVYAQENGQGQRLATLHSGASVETLGQSGESTQVRLTDGTTGWVKSTFLTTDEPAVVRVKQLEDELDRLRATTPALAEAAEQSEVQSLTRELDAARTQLAAVRGGAMPAGTPAGILGPWILQRILPLTGVAVLVLLGCGFWLGYAALARRVRRKFGGIKVY
jgi:hypothetical protein